MLWVIFSWKDWLFSHMWLTTTHWCSWTYRLFLFWIFNNQKSVRRYSIFALNSVQYSFTVALVEHTAHALINMNQETICLLYSLLVDSSWNWCWTCVPLYTWNLGSWSLYSRFWNIYIWKLRFWSCNWFNFRRGVTWNRTRCSPSVQTSIYFLLTDSLSDQTNLDWFLGVEFLKSIRILSFFLFDFTDMTDERGFELTLKLVIWLNVHRSQSLTHERYISFVYIFLFVFILTWLWLFLHYWARFLWYANHKLHWWINW